MPIRATATGVRTKVLEPLEWAFPASPVPDRELIERHPDAGPATDRPPLLFVHGHSHGAWCWDEHWMPAAAAQGWSCYAVSLRGHGGSAGGEHLKRATLRSYEHDVLQAITALPAPPVLIGHSMGALVVQRVLERYLAAPAAVLVTPAGNRHGLGIMGNLARRRPGQLVRGAALRPIRFNADDLFAGLDPHTADRHLERLSDEAPLAQLELMLPRRRYVARCPVLVVGAGDDRIVPVTDIVRTARRYGTRARIFRGIGHAPMLDAGWSAPLATMLAWLSETSRI